MRTTNTFPTTLGKISVIQRLAAANGIQDVNPWSDTVGDVLSRVHAIAGAAINEDVAFARAEELGGAEQTFFEAGSRKLAPAQHRNGRPDCFPPLGGEIAFSPALKSVTLKSGLFWNLAENPLIISADAGAVVVDYSSRYSRLINYYDLSIGKAAQDAYNIPGTVFVLADDVRPLNFCHWLVDWLPRLTVLGPEAKAADCYVLTTPLAARYQLQTLQMCGFMKERVVEISSFQMYRAGRLVATSDLPRCPHPAFKAAPWAVSYLQATLGFRSALTQRHSLGSLPKKIYISRSDAEGRRIQNEDEVIQFLAKAGYLTVTLSTMEFSAQATLFAQATHIIGLHGAGLSHCVFITERATVIEIFPATYGTPAFYVLTVGLGNRYASYIASSVISNARNQLDDIRIDISHFSAVCGDLV